MKSSNLPLNDWAVLHYDCFARSVRIWKWPLDALGRRIAPADLLDHRESHDMILPGCLCGMRPGPGWVESAVYPATAGPFRGHYIASCADGRCEYAVNLDRVYIQELLATKYYPTRGDDDTAPPEIRVANRAHLSRESIRPHAIPVYHPPAPVTPTPFDLLLRLDSQSQPGITLEQFLALFVQCAACRLVMTMRATNVHNCALPEGEQDTRGHGTIDLREDREE
ncbi:hypothetical protein BV25DRAFT_1921865 [Artomyces pyxidatus]|uniref:Uncharacterized protein n=1 Tax=Artomyces pyxidatus TaxID=48021 RepID=A0ACB8SH64_9AGAM|nr:hypothetical protein BV25DRAFT_1921865 [Artomyces pyxidatus]